MPLLLSLLCLWKRLDSDTMDRRRIEDARLTLVDVVEVEMTELASSSVPLVDDFLSDLTLKTLRIRFESESLSLISDCTEYVDDADVMDDRRPLEDEKSEAPVTEEVVEEEDEDGRDELVSWLRGRRNSSSAALCCCFRSADDRCHDRLLLLCCEGEKEEELGAGDLEVEDEDARCQLCGDGCRVPGECMRCCT